ncbi:MULTISPECIES: hypothetical protein [Aeromonas]|uniref:Uncharacterized protein n=1 Tax=Aeromonas caviae TaxID=648 RepID=A0AAJ6CQ56_AERCA|nr:hypothetical protein [Aeromonas caviae]RWT77749.1 hypothetical protein DN604_07210 [Aeromonas caviae]WFG00297.1 hypothetical protein P5S46_21280 [Aeromonas caviae]WVM48118.1 hypothetical protein V0242_24570 [Aeromonas hydrophila]
MRSNMDPQTATEPQHSADISANTHEHWLDFFMRATKPETLVRMARSAVNKNAGNVQAIIAIRVAEDIRENQLINDGYTSLDFDYADQC